MRSLSDTIARLAALRARGDGTPSSDQHLVELSGFGSNPGALLAKVHIPKSLPRHAALVVVLHGCTQNAEGYDTGTGWSSLADRYGFAVLYPEQQRANNPNLCFNWFTDEDTRRDSGEVLSIRQMIEAVCVEQSIDRARVFVTGLSAGGAMANSMLATYPEVFAGGAIIAGLPYGTANTVPQAFDRMRGQGLGTGDALRARLAAASPHQGPWPTISVWQGTADTTVVPANAPAIIEQWRGVHGAAALPDVVDAVEGHVRETWKNARGETVIERYSINGMAHGSPLDIAGNGVDSDERSGPFLLDVGLSSTRQIARSWGLTPSFERRSAAKPARPGGPALAAPRAEQPASPRKDGIQKVIEDALRSAGLMR